MPAWSGNLTSAWGLSSLFGALGAGDDLDPSFWPGSGTGLMLGDMGSVYVFVCRQCEGWPVAGVLQST